jgi:hypothetical protein
MMRAPVRCFPGGVTLSAVLTAALALTACGGDGDAAKTGSTRLVPAGTKVGKLDITVTEPKPGRFRYYAPKTIRAGLVRIRLKNEGADIHKAQLRRVGEGHSVEEALRIGRPWPPWLTYAGGTSFARAGKTATAVQRLDPGTYWVGDDAEDRGEIATLRVIGEPADAKLPAPQAKVTAVDYAFKFSDLEAGHAAVEFANSGKEPHHAYFALLRDGRTVAEALAFFEGKLSGPPPIDTEQNRETTVLEGGQRQVTRLELQSGRYAVLCFVSDRGGGPPHTEKGMLAEVKVP